MYISRLISFAFTAVFLFCFAGCGSSNTNITNTQKYRTVIDSNLSSDDTLVWQKANWANGNPFYNAWCEQQVSFSNDSMLLTLEQTPCNGFTHASGEYRSNNSFQYGRYTTRMKASGVMGTVTSFFTYTGPSEGTVHDEIDIEILAKDPTKMQVNYWQNGVEHPTLLDLGFDASADFHIYSFIWHISGISWYVDGILVHSEDGSKGALPSLPGNIIMNLWACNGIDAWCGTYLDGSIANAIYDYVRFEEAL